MINLFFLTLYIFTPIVMVFLLRIAGEKINQISILNVTTLSIYTFAVLGLLPLFYQWDAYRAEVGVNNPILIIVVLICSFASIVFFLFGAIFIRRGLRLKPLPIVSSEISPLKTNSLFKLKLILLFVAIIVIIYSNKVEQIAIFSVLRGDDIFEITKARSLMGNDFSGYYRYALVMQQIGNLVTIAFFVNWLVDLGKNKFIWFLCSFMISSFVSLMATEKAPFISLLMSLFISYFLVKNNGFIPKKSLVVFGGVILLLLVNFYIYFMGSASFLTAFMDVLSRAFSGSISPAYFYLEYVPDIQEYYFFKTFPNPGGILPYEAAPYTIDIMNWKFPYHIDLGIVGSMPTVFWGEAYLNFGFLSIPMISFLMGCLVAIISYWVSRFRLNSISIAFLVWLIFHYKALSITGFSGYVYDVSLLGIFLVVIFVTSDNFKIHLRVIPKNKRI